MLSIHKNCVHLIRKKDRLLTVSDGSLLKSGILWIKGSRSNNIVTIQRQRINPVAMTLQGPTQSTLIIKKNHQIKILNTRAVKSFTLFTLLYS